MKHSLFEGCAVALITPFDKQGDVDYAALKNFVEFQIENGTDALVACGTTGEPATMTAQEWDGVLKCVIDTAHGRVPVIAGTGGNNTRGVIEKAARAFELGADGQLCVTPYYNKATQNGLVAHYTAVHDQTALPIIVYNVPARTGLNMKPETVHKLCALPRIAGIKEATGDAAQAADVIALCGDDMPLYSGSDELTVQLRAIGSKGVISVLANIAPKWMHDMTHLPIQQAAALQLNAMKLIRLLFCEVNPIPVKAAAAAMGLCENVLRLPLTPMASENETLLVNELKRLNIVC